MGWLVLPAHVVLAGAVLFAVGFAYVFTGSLYDGFTSWFGYLLIPAIGAGLTVPIVVVIGLPLRIARPLRRWWMTHGGWFVTLCVLGLAVIAASYLVGSAGYLNEPATADTRAFTVFVPDSTIFLVGWFILAFGLAHFWWPLTWRTRAARAAALARFTQVPRAG